MRAERYRLLREPDLVLVLDPQGHECAAAAPVAACEVERPALPELVSRAALLAVQIAAESHPELVARVHEIAALALARLLVEMDRMPPKRAVRVVFRAVEA